MGALRVADIPVGHRRMSCALQGPLCALNSNFSAFIPQTARRGAAYHMRPPLSVGLMVHALQTFGILSRNHAHACAAYSASCGNLGTSPAARGLDKNRRVAREAAGRFRPGRDAPSLARLLMTSATENPRPLPRLNVLLDWPVASHSMAAHGRRRGRHARSRGCRCRRGYSLPKILIDGSRPIVAKQHQRNAVGATRRGRHRGRLLRH
jgi:hypothetical protein